MLRFLRINFSNFYLKTTYRISFNIFYMEAQKSEGQSFVRRDRLLKIEEEAHKVWAEHKFHESNPSDNPKKYMVTFPYPYMNGRLHLGHAYSMTKAEFTIRYKRLKGYNAFWPFSFHCTGMPIAAAAVKLRREYEQQGEGIKAWADKLEAEFKAEVEKAKKDPKYEVKTKIPQYTILKMCGIPDEEIHKFKDADYWLRYFPELGKTDLERFGVHCDFRRSFITTEINPYYDAFVRWQFWKLKEKGYIDFGKRPTIYAPADGQACADHDRAEGEGAGPQEYTLIKLRLLDFPEELKPLEGKKVFLVAATLRPETMYGQTNCYILPTGKYGAFEMQNDEIFICSERAARNMAYQGLTKEAEKFPSLLQIEGSKLIGCGLKSPLTKYEKIYLWPMTTISMEKGTGIVTSVPSDAPDDWVSLRELHKKPEWRAKWGLKDEQVLPFEPVPIMDVPELGNLSALKACEDLKVNGPGDKDKLAKAKEMCYDAAFYKGVMTVGKYSGQKVFDVKNLIKQDMIAEGDAAQYYEPDAKVVSRGGEVCVVAFCDQWYIKYGEPNWQKSIKDHVQSNNFNTYNKSILKAFEEAIDWLKEWAVSRNFGQGTRVPWDPQFLIESLSDSTIYMALYTIAHHLQGDMEGTKPGLLGVDPKDLTNDVFDYVFLGTPYKQGNIPEEKLRKMREEFEYWYPLDLRVSAKDLVRNHLTMSLYNHAAIWENPKYWPRGFFCNGYITVNGDKMSKSKGNFLTLNDCINNYGADATRIALADAGDTLDDANFVQDTANSGVLRLANLETWIKWAIDNLSKMREDSTDEYFKWVDHGFSNEIDKCIVETDKAYDSMRFRDVLKYGLYDLSGMKEEYLLQCQEDPANMNRNIVLKYIEAQLIVLYPVCPHFSDIVYNKYLKPHVANKPDYISLHRFPEIDHTKIDHAVIRAREYVKTLFKTIRDSLSKYLSKKKGQQPKKCTLIIASKYFDWQLKVLDVISNTPLTPENKVPDTWKAEFKTMTDKPLMAKSLKFGSYIIDQYQSVGKEAFSKELPFVEKELIEKNMTNLKREFKIENFEIIEAVSVADSKDKLIATAAGNTLPGLPEPIFE